jgi:TPR repeat protein
MQQSASRISASAGQPIAADLVLKLVVLSLILIVYLAPRMATAGAMVARAGDTGWQEVTQLGTAQAVERAFLQGVVAYQDGDYARATKLWYSPAEQGHALAQFNLGVAYATGQGAEVDYAQAARWWEAAGYQSHTAAQYNLGLLYSRGQGVEKSIAKARMWWYMAALSGGDPAAQFHLGALAATGEGEAQDFSEAAWWWTRSAAQGYEHAVKGLEILKQHGSVQKPNDYIQEASTR